MWASGLSCWRHSSLCDPASTRIERGPRRECRRSFIYVCTQRAHRLATVVRIAEDPVVQPRSPTMLLYDPPYSRESRSARDWRFPSPALGSSNTASRFDRRVARLGANRRAAPPTCGQQRGAAAPPHPRPRFRLRLSPRLRLCRPRLPRRRGPPTRRASCSSRQIGARSRAGRRRAR